MSRAARARRRRADGRDVGVGWSYVGFEVVALAGDQHGARPASASCASSSSQGAVHVRSEHGDWLGLGGRDDPFAGLPDAAYLPPRTRPFELSRPARRSALCFGAGGRRRRGRACCPARDRGRDARPRRPRARASTRS